MQPPKFSKITQMIKHYMPILINICAEVNNFTKNELCSLGFLSIIYFKHCVALCLHDIGMQSGPFLTMLPVLNTFNRETKK